MHRTIAPAIFCMMLVASCARQSEWSRTASWKDYSLQTIPGAEQYPHDGAIILLDEGAMEIRRGGDGTESSLERHRLVRILNASGHRYANIVLPYGASSRIEQIEARTIAPDGHITELDQGDIFDVSLYPNFVFFSDHRARLFTFPAVENGSLIEYRYRLVVRGVTYWHAWAFQEEIPVLISRFLLSIPPGWDVIHRSYGLNVPPVVTTTPARNVSTYLWELHDVLPLVHEEGMPPTNEIVIRLAIAPLGFRTWNDVGRWYGEIVRPRMDANEAITLLADSLTRDANSPSEKLRRLYGWVRDHIRYVAVEIGIGGYEPHVAPEVLAKRYGDCKDMVLLLCSLARSAGLTVIPALISTAQNGRPDSTLPSPFQFNHLIAYAPAVGERGIWMDPTEKSLWDGSLPWYDEGLPVLLAGQSKDLGIAITPRSDASRNRLSIVWDADLTFNGSARVRGTLQAWGAVSMELREDFRLMGQTECRRWIENHLAARCSSVTLDTFQVSGVDTPLDPLSIHYQFSTPLFAVQRSSGLVMRPGEIMGSELPDVFRSPFRNHPIRFKFGTRTEVRTIIHLPDGYTPDVLQWTDSLSTPFGSARWTWTTSERTSTLDAKYETEGEEIPARKYKLFREYLDRLRTKDLRELTFLPQ